MGDGAGLSPGSNEEVAIEQRKEEEKQTGRGKLT
jgi:hypothetical protein